jgi:DNA polymerase elongation subunit (family B)
MYKNFYFDRHSGLCHLWTDEEGKEYQVFPFEQYAYQVDPKGEYTTLTGLKVKKVKNWSKEAEKQGMIFEHDVPIATRVLIDRYFESDEPSKGHRILFFDIEVKKGLRYSTPKEALNEITSIAYYYDGKYVCLLWDETGTLKNCTKEIVINGQNLQTDVLVFKTERELLMNFLVKWVKISPTIVSGWNCVSEGTYVMLNDRLKKIEKTAHGDPLPDGNLINVLMDSGFKEEINIITKVGSILKCSENHIIPAYSVPFGRYTHDKSVDKYKIETDVKTIIELSKENGILLSIPKITNDNKNLTYKQFLLDNLDKLLSYENFDLYIKSPKIVEFVKTNQALFPQITERDRWGIYAGNKWRLKSLLYIPMDMIYDFIKESETIDFAFGSVERVTLNIECEIDNDICQLLGFIYTDGFYSKRNKTYHFCNKDEDCIDHYTQLIKTHNFKRNSFIPKRAKRDGCFYVDISSQNYLGLLFSFIYENDFKKNLNVEFLSLLSYEQFCAFISGAVDGDGSVKENAIEICNYEKTHEINVQSFQRLFFRNGILSKVEKNSIRIPANGKNNEIFIKSLNITHSKRREKWYNINFSKKLNSKTKSISWIETDTDFLVKVKDIVRTGKQVQMYDINTNTGYFIADSVNVHNCNVFDCPYLYNRMCNVLGRPQAQKLSPIKVVYERPMNKRDICIKIAGVAQMDYMQLYKKFTYNEESSYSLESISQKELKRGKFKYDGTLDDLFRDNIDGFIEYNVNDVELLVALDKKMDLIEIARGICHAGHVPYEDYEMSSRYLEGASLVYCKRNNLVAIRSTIGESDQGQAEGALVKPPKPGIYEYVIDLDLTSLYPSLIRTLNISPETIFGKVQNWIETEFNTNLEKIYVVDEFTTLQEKLMGGDDKRTEMSKDELWTFLQENNLSIASNGVLFKKEKEGLIPAILTQWFNERKRLSKLAEEYGNKGDEVNYKFYDQRQLIQKILLNSFYGVLLLPSFRFYNKNAGEAITITGQNVISFSMKVANHFCNVKLNTKDVDYVAAGDTDSMFLTVYPIINPNNENLDKDELVRRTLDFAKEVQNFINKSYDVYASKLHNVETHYLNIKQEMIAIRCFFLSAKKRYALWIINNKGVSVDKVEVKGLDIVRSSFPKMFRQEMKRIINDILQGVPIIKLNEMVRSFKKEYKQSSIWDIMLPTSVKEISKYKTATKGVPIHVKSAQNYNKLLDLHKIESIPQIDDGDKILYAYMKQNPFGFETMALKGQGEDPEQIVAFVEQFIDREKVFQQTFISKLDTIWEDLGWGKVEQNEPNPFF